MKKCGRCKLQKNDDEFFASQLNTSGGRCRACNTEICRKYREKNKDKIEQYNKKYMLQYYQENRKKVLENKKEYYKKNKEEILEDRKEYYTIIRDKKLIYNKLYYRENREKILKVCKIYSLNNKEKRNKYQNYYIKNRKKTSFCFRLKCNISANINCYLKSNGLSKNKKSTLKYLPYRIEELEQHLELLFESWMTWQNYGKYDSKTWDDNDQSTWKWQIDHIIPHSTFKYTSMEDQEFKDCWSLSNLRPLSAKKNFTDGMNRVRHKSIILLDEPALAPVA